ncbi:hypothetical protein AADG42_14500 [Ammonicoccus fulvus]|uniref:Uncharacterized protein n=1 Tax=Ammonicoccus fulvus TaxID=3138240 RepID=A0ABZ3FQV4_9ACTN
MSRGDTPASTSKRPSLVLGCFGVALVLIITAGVVGVAWLRQQRQIAPLPFETRCVATGPSGSVSLTLDQSRWTAIVVGMGVRHQVGVHGATIAMATVYQETGIRNLEYGDRDSLGLFQQRPSQDWGTPEQIMDPWYSSEQFYEALVEVPGWKTGDVNDTAQAVQRSGHPQAYRKHEQNARVLAEAFTGEAIDGVSCFDERRVAGRPAELGAEITRTFGDPVTQDGSRLEIVPGDAARARAVAAYAIANAGEFGVTSVETGGRTWTASQTGLPSWQAGGDVPEGTSVITLR